VSKVAGSEEFFADAFLHQIDINNSLELKCLLELENDLRSGKNVSFGFI
jgi:hypothetical protein